MSDDQCGHVRLRNVLESDLEPFHVYEQDAEAVRRSRFTPRERERFMAWATKIIDDPGVYVQTITVDDAPAGHVMAWWEEDGRRFLGYWLGRRYWGRGLGTTALALFLRHERNRPLYADPFHGNTASVRLLERHGFRRTGTVRHGEDEHVLLVLDAESAPRRAQ